MLIGIIFSMYLPGVSIWLDQFKIGNMSIPIGICLFLMRYPALLNFQMAELKKLAKAPKPILLTLFSNWVIAPIITALLAYYFLDGNDQLIIA